MLIDRERDDEAILRAEDEAIAAAGTPAAYRWTDQGVVDAQAADLAGLIAIVTDQAPVSEDAQGSGGGLGGDRRDD